MTAKAEESTSVALVSPAAIGVLPPEVQQRLELRKLSNQIAGKLAEMNWGKQMDLTTRRAIADWGQRYGVDPATEIHVLGGNIYLNASYYLRRLAGLIARGVVEYAYADHIEDDERLKAMGGDGVGEANRRLRERIMYQVPDKAAAAVVFRIKLRSMTREIVGVKWCGGGTRKNDPVGDANPVETAESRAARRAIRQIITHVPEDASEIIEAEDAAEVLSETVTQRRVEAKAYAAADAHRNIGLPAVDPNDPYALAADAQPSDPPPLDSLLGT